MFFIDLFDQDFQQRLPFHNLSNRAEVYLDHLLDQSFLLIGLFIFGTVEKSLLGRSGGYEGVIDLVRIYHKVTDQWLDTTWAEACGIH